MSTFPHRPVGAILVSLFFTEAAFSQTNRPLHESRPPLPEFVQEFFLSDAVRCQDAGELQITSSVDSRQGIGSDSRLELQYGLTNRLQIGLELPYGSREEEELLGTGPELGTISLGVGYQLIRSDAPFALSVGFAFGIPVEATQEVEYEPTILIARGFGKLQVHASVLANLENEKPSFQYNVASVYSIQNRWFPTFEFNGRRLHGVGALYVTPGLYRRFKSRLEVGIGTPLGVAGQAGAAGIVGKVTWEIGRQRESE